MGRLAVIDGLDGCGKQTQTELLATCLRQEGIPVKQITFPTYTLDEVNVYAASTFYAVDRYASFCRDWGSDYNAGRLVLTDRYVTANVIHQMGKLPRERWEDYLEWLSDLEYTRFGLPRPDVVFYLELPLETADALLAGRYAGQQHKKDLHERDRAYLRQCRETARFAAQRLGWQVVHCGDGAGGIRPAQDISRELRRLLGQTLGL